jgi:hypothetical protein
MLGPRTEARERLPGSTPRLARWLVLAAAVAMASLSANMAPGYASAFRPAMSHGSHRVKPPVTAAGHQTQPGSGQPKAGPPHPPGR